LEELSGGLFGNAPLRNFIENDPWGENPMPCIEKKKWSYVQCKDCTQMFHRFVLSPEWNEIRFSEWMTLEAMQKFGETINTPSHHFDKAKQHVSHILCLEKMTRSLRNNGAVRILDFGCGWGEFLAMCDRFGFIGYGIDRSSARRQFGQHVTIFPEIDDLKNKPKTQGFHIITLFEVLEHLDDPLTILQALKDYLIPGGILVLETPDCSGVKGINSESEYRKIHPLDHINGFTPDTLRTIAERAGFTSIKPDISHVTSDRLKVVKTEIKELVYGYIKSRTQLYFQKT
jgi:SAM-dependent methyltransferase